MQEILEKELEIVPGCADSSGEIGVYETFRVFMDMAAMHAERLGVGFDAMAKRGIFWLTVKTRIDFKKRPRMAQTVTLRTWPEMPEKIRANRSYEMVLDGETVITGKTEWAIINTETHRLVPMKGIFPDELRFEKPTACEGAFAHIADDFSENDRVDEYRVRSIDIDVGGHMNNAAYVKVLMAGFSNEELSGFNIRRMDVIFRAPCFEGDMLTVFRRRTETGFELRISRRDETVTLASIEC